MEKDILIREATLDDKVPLCELMTQLGYQISDADMEERIHLYNAHPLNKAWVAEYQANVIGSVAVDIIELFHRKGRFARVISIIIDASYRGKGIGKALMQCVEDYSRQIGCIRIELTTDWHRAKTGTHDFYRNLQYSELRLYLAKEIK